LKDKAFFSFAKGRVARIPPWIFYFTILNLPVIFAWNKPKLSLYEEVPSPDRSWMSAGIGRTGSEQQFIG